MFYCQTFTEDDIPNKLWMEIQQGAMQQGNEQDLEMMLNDKIFKNLEIMTHPAMRSFFQIGTEDQDV